MEKCERQYKKELKKLASQMQLIIEMFFIQINKKNSYNAKPAINSLLSLHCIEKLIKK